MKTSLLIITAVLTALELSAQGVITFTSQTLTRTTHVWGPSPGDPYLFLVGRGSNDVPPGTTPYQANGMSLIGTGGRTGPYGYETTFAELLVGPGASQPASSLVPVGPVTTFRSGAALGEIVQINVIVPGLTPDYTAATCSAAFWDNSSGLCPTWAQASVAWEAGLIAANCAPLENVLLTAGGGTYQPMTLNLGFVPEPAAVVLVGVGVSCLIFSRRRR